MNPENLTAPVIQEVRGNGIGILTLNSPRTLNALTLEMVEELDSVLINWERDPNIRAVILRGEGSRSFCAGGDVKRVALSLRDPETRYPEQFFTTEYRVDYRIRTYLKPLAVLGQGLVLGGGLGLLSGASFRVITPETQIGMPEISIGLYPDVGGSYFLSRLPQGLGTFLAWTASRVGPKSALALGFADFCIPEASFPAVIDAWAASPSAEPDRLAQLIRPFSVKLDALPEEPLQVHAARASHIGRSPTPLQAAREFQAILDSPNADPWLKDCAKTFLEGSPTSAWLIQEQLRRGERLSLEAAFQMELGLSIQIGRLGTDFREGVRARLIDKDHTPRWNPARREEVSPSDIARYFESPWDKAAHPLKNLGLRESRN